MKTKFNILAGLLLSTLLAGQAQAVPTHITYSGVFTDNYQGYTGFQVPGGLDGQAFSVAVDFDSAAMTPEYFPDYGGYTQYTGAASWTWSSNLSSLNYSGETVIGLADGSQDSIWVRPTSNVLFAGQGGYQLSSVANPGVNAFTGYGLSALASLNSSNFGYYNRVDVYYGQTTGNVYSQAHSMTSLALTAQSVPEAGLASLLESL